MQRAFLNACLRGNTNVVQDCLKDPNVDPSFRDNQAIVFAASFGFAGVTRVLLEDPRVDPSVKDNEAFCRAAENGHVKVVRLLLTDARVNPSARGHYALRWAAYNAHVDVLLLLLSVHHKRKYSRLAIIHARASGDGALLLALMTHPSTNLKNHTDLYTSFHPFALSKYKSTLAQCFGVAFVATQLPPWQDMVLFVSERLKAGFL